MKRVNGAGLTLSSNEQSLLLRLARRRLEVALAEEDGIEVEHAEIPPALMRKAACFVTLTKDKGLRGCMLDSFIPHEPLYKNAMRNIVLAATNDPRFPPVVSAELSAVWIEISVLDPPKPLSYDGPDELLSKLVPGRDGVILTTRYGRSTYLPHVWDAFPDAPAFLSSLCVKQGAPADCWRDDRSIKVEIYRVFHFGEEADHDR